MKPCKRCVQEQEIISPEKIAALAAEIKLEPSLAADEETYQNRIAACGDCDALRGKVLCFHCGCFIFTRARPIQNYCPHPSGNRWS